MIRAGRFGALSTCPLLLACSLVNSLDPCEGVKPHETRVNESGDAFEFLDHPKAAAEISGNRVAVVFSAQ